MGSSSMVPTYHFAVCSRAGRSESRIDYAEHDKAIVATGCGCICLGREKLSKSRYSENSEQVFGIYMPHRVDKERCPLEILPRMANGGR